MGKALFRANLNLSVSPATDLAAVEFHPRQPETSQVDNNVNSFWYNGSMGPG
jgi:hypothetical protein